MFLTRISISRPVFATMMMIAIMVLGVFAWRSLPIDRYPNVDFPVVAVVVPYPGASPESVESDITKPVEDELNTLSGIEELSSTSSASSSLIVVKFKLEMNSALAAQDVRDRIAAVAPDLPEDAKTPVVMRHNPTETPVMSLAVSSPSLDPGRLSRLTEDVIVPALTTVTGVGSADVVGSVEDQVAVQIDPDRLRAYGLGVSDVIEALRQGNLLQPAGSVTTGATVRAVQVNAESRTPELLADMIIARQAGAEVRLGDVATVTASTSDAKSLAFRNGQPALAIDVLKVDGANTVAVAADVKRAIDRLKSRIGDARIDVLVNSADAIEANYATVRSTLMEGALLAVLIVFVFLNSWRSTVITALTLPISFLGTLAVISLLGFSLNMMTMLALTLTVGILIDDAIVVRENIMRHLHMGKNHVVAALDGTAEIGLAVVATTLSLCAVFLPLAFMEGIVGRFFLQFGVTVAVAVLISLFVSFTLDPMLSSVWYDPAAHPGAKRGPVGKAIARFDRLFEAAGRAYRGVLGLCLRFRKTTLAFAIGIFAGSLVLLPTVGIEFLPKGDESRLTIGLKTAVGSSKEYTALKAGQVSDILAKLPEVTGVYASVAAGSGSAETEATIEANLVGPEERSLSADAMVPGVRALLGQVPGVELTVAAAGGLGADEAPIAVEVFGADPQALAGAAGKIADMIARIPGTADVTLSVDTAQPILDFAFMPDVASDLGVSAREIGSALRTLVDGTEASTMKRPDGTTVPVVVRLPDSLRSDPEQLGALPVVKGEGHGIALNDVARLESSVGPAKIKRQNRARVITVEAALNGRVLGDVMAEIDAGLAGMDLPEGVTVGQDGDADLMDETAASMMMALSMAVIFIYLVLASQFGSFLQPLAIMAALPLALAGVVVGLMAGGSTMNLYSMIGLVMLMGLVVKNAILLVDNANQQAAKGLPLPQALIEAGTNRFRPIVMTTLAMIFGMLPLALAIHPGSQQSASMAQAVIGGLISSTLLTLVVVPVMLTYLAQLSSLFRRIFGGPAAPLDHEPEGAMG